MIQRWSRILPEKMGSGNSWNLGREALQIMLRKAIYLGVILVPLSAVFLFLAVWQRSADDVPVLPTLAVTAVQPPPVETTSAEQQETESVAVEGQLAPDPTLDPDPTTSSPVIHTVQAGETLFRIAVNFDVPIESLIALNGISDPSLVYTGQQLTIPPAAALVDPAGQMAGPPTTESQPEPPAPPTTVNGLPVSSFFSLPPATLQNINQILANGLALGRNPRAFSKVGDSTIENPYFLTRFDQGPYNLGEYAYLQDVIDHFSGSYGRQGAAVRQGLHSWTVTDPTWADKTICLANESPFACEIRLHNPVIALIRLGSNDAGVPEGFNQNMRQIVEISISSGVIPILGTKADRHEGGNNINNGILRQIAADYNVPLWDFDLVAGTIPGRGLDIDYVHLTTFYAHDYSSPLAFQRGHSMHNLSALIVLDIAWREIIRPVTG